MALDRIGLSLVKMLSATRPLGNVLTLGKQHLEVGPLTLRRSLGVKDGRLPHSTEDLLTTFLGANTCDSLDASAFEGATHVWDLNEPIPQFLQGRFDTVLDLGTLEHVFDVKTAFRNVSSLCASGGVIAHVLPADRLCGHGFYQFSPTFFSTYYSDIRGFSQTEVYVVRSGSPRRWWRLDQLIKGERVNLRARGKLFVVAIASPGVDADIAPVQQGDYELLWHGGRAESDGAQVVSQLDSPTKRWIRNSPFANVSIELVKTLRAVTPESQRLTRSSRLSATTEDERLDRVKFGSAHNSLDRPESS